MSQNHILPQNSITNAVLEWNESGTPVSNDFDDVYFSNDNGLEETRYVFLQQNHLPQRWQEYDQRRFVIGETGFGTGLNFLAVWQWFKEFRSQYPDAPLKELHFVSFEKFPVTKSDLIKAHQAWPELAQFAEQLQEHYPAAVPDCHRLVLEDGMITLDLWFGDIKDCMPQIWMDDKGLIDAWFLDGFAPSKNPEMWNQTLFNNMASLAKENCTCATFTAAGFVRRGLIEAGFDMKKVKGFGHKREMIAGTLTERTTKANHEVWYARSTKENITDVAIIGGGVASAALATTLIRRGVKVSVYCKDEKSAQGASGNKQGAVYPLLNEKFNSLSRFFAPGFIFARQFIDQAAKHVEFDHDWCGVTQLKWDEKSANKLNKMLEGNFPNELVSSFDIDKTNQMVGLPINMESVHYPLGGWLCPKQLTRGLFEHLSNNPLFTLHCDSEITALTQNEQQQWLLSTDSNTYQHQAVVVANGHRFTDFEQTKDIPATPVRGQVSHIPTTESLKNLNTVLCYDGYLTPENSKHQTHCIGASYDRRDLGLAFKESDQIENGERLRKCIPNETWPNDVDTSDNQARIGIRCASRDHLPFIGNVVRFEDMQEEYKNIYKKRHWLREAKDIPVYDGLFCMLTLGSRGLSSAPLLAETLASQIMGDPIPLPNSVLEGLHPGRLWVRRLLKGKPLDI
ncbi:bifunctional tRNA (5-methylaminomethyl-2-thiouridylate)-methyltransferase MnmD/FAD-dependent cmnm(5)s(2)U34 oxidoreductase MnmC [Aliivibrio fischeri]|uniref:tRNA 5-methylaminomethyl-2-thiouridine biosynthesis bifunctional protein MnmC n=1 Tax=Aliivibrio fischeri (strain MJ11) TaxID=388396 RepID=B5FFP2_ALIFM|nr:bifunctional tRNA (5-methylaminomethyl-2-thiouridine)(34)-methyltransferase MnmD/FAD-dependent 5-carboxymethylaminomethyl-2-thiouridine(34) oxidoreductase MnmC [Aliivibrio fischeri]ACH66472.1 protein YfcK [Aliivibrio fischeri MJ11]OCH10922.1 bifunctional tRNA (5-methylaminomethyl-2-thiouridylate)-methyltransferase MnmD/FAD-dependent cmnm(5)s(2)U34 oxidoreductase MnmC [Aliivibrio fischeri]OCH19391.1 bifunctional tRNA (5-methylaminomethyl-2-thiouridylate)-methyltransferase MnmD/FAD-dependent cm